MPKLKKASKSANTRSKQLLPVTVLSGFLGAGISKWFWTISQTLEKRFGVLFKTSLRDGSCACLVFNAVRTHCGSILFSSTDSHTINVCVK